MYRRNSVIIPSLSGQMRPYKAEAFGPKRRREGGHPVLLGWMGTWSEI